MEWNAWNANRLRANVITMNRIHTEYKPYAALWFATLDGYEPGEPFGEAKTEVQAVADLLHELKPVEHCPPCPYCGKSESLHYGNRRECP